MSLLATPTFAGAAESETFYVRVGAPEVAGVSSVQGVSGAVGITSTDGSITVLASGQNVNLNTTGNALTPSSVAATGAVSGATVAASGSVTGATVAGTTVSATGTVSGATVSASGQLIQLGQLLPSLLPRGCQTLSGTVIFQNPIADMKVAEFGVNAPSVSGLPVVAISGTPIFFMMTACPANRNQFLNGGDVPMTVYNQWAFPRNDGTYAVANITGMNGGGGGSGGVYLEVLPSGAANGTMRNYVINAHLQNATLYNTTFNWNITILNCLQNVAY